MNTYRPRISRERRDEVIAAGTALNGEEVRFHEALGLLTRYLDVLNNDVACPQCGEEDIEDMKHGRYRCWTCEEEDRPAVFQVWDYLDVDNEEEATLPGTKEEIQYRFECDEPTGSPGSNTEQSTQSATQQQTSTRQNAGKPGFDDF